MRLFDTHCHIGLIHEDYLEQLLTVQYAKRAGVAHIVSICNSLTDFEVIYKNLKSAKNVYHAVGVSPTESGNRLLDWDTKILQFLKLDRIVAIGETGLDYGKYSQYKGVQVEMFCYSEDWEYAFRALDLPVYFSFAGNITYKNVRKLTDTVKKLPQDRILIESEAPFMVPAKYTKRRNKPEYLPETAQAVSYLRGVPLEEMSEILYQNSLNAFHLTEA